MLYSVSLFDIILTLPAGTASTLPTSAEGLRTLFDGGTEAGKQTLSAQLNMRYFYA